MRRIISALLISISTTLAVAQGATPLQLTDGAPDRHVVVSGDTLWGISAKFLKDPYRWGELWKLNAEEIRNPQLIYPGQVILLDKSGAQPRLKLATVTEQRREYVEPLRKGIPSIPPREIEPFLSEARVLDANGLDDAPRVVALQGDRVVAGAGDTIYTTAVAPRRRRILQIFRPGEAPAAGADEGEPTEVAQQKIWQIFRPGKALVDPDTNETLGHEAVFVGTARLTATGATASYLILSSKMEVVTNDRLLEAPRQDVVNYLPHRPATTIKGKVLGIYGGVNFGGPQAVVTLNRGKADGLEPGHVLAIDMAGVEITNRYGRYTNTYQLPDTRNGLVFVFRVFDRVSYAMIMSATVPVVVGDTVRTP